MTSFIKSTSYYTVANILPNAVGFLFLPIYSRYMTPYDFGIVSAMEALTYIFSIIVCFNLDRAAQRFYFDKNDLSGQKKLLSTLFISSILFACSFVFMAILLEPVLQSIFTEIAFYPFFVFCILNVALNSLGLIVAVYYQVSEQPRKYMALKIIRFISQILMVVYFVVWISEGAIGQLKAEFIVAGLFVPIYIVIAHKNFGWVFDVEILKKSLSYVWPFIPTLLVAWVMNLSDRIFIERYVGLGELGIYSMGYKISMVFFILTSAFSMAFTPVFYKLANSDDQVKAKKKIYNYTSFAVVIFTFLMLAISLFAKEVSDYMLDMHYAQSYEIVRIIIVSHLLSAIMGVTSVLYLLQAKKTKLNMLIAFYAAIFNIILNFMLIPSYGMFGAALATVVSMIGLTVIQYQKSKSGYFIPVPWGRLFFLIMACLVIIAFYQYYLELFPIISIISKVILLSMVIVVAYLWGRNNMSRYIG